MNTSNMAIFPDYGQKQTDDPYNFSFDYNWGAIPQPVPETSVFEDISTAVSGTGSYVFDSAAGAWETVKQGAMGAVNSAGEALSSSFNWLENRVLIYIGVALLVLVVLARTGILNQISSILFGVAAVKG